MERPMSEDDQPKLEKNVPTSALAGHEEEKEEVVWDQIITPDGKFKRPSSDGIYGSLEVLKQPIIARLKELISMDPTVEVGIEMNDSVYLLNLINSANPEMQHAGLIARNAKHMQEVAPVVIRSQQIMRSALLLQDNIVNMPPECFDGAEVGEMGHEEKKKEVVWDQIITPDGMFKRPSSDGIYGSLEVLKQAIIARLEELTSMDPTVEVGIEINDSVYLLNLINSANPEMQNAGLIAREGAKKMQEGAHSVIHSQQILRSALLLEDNIVNMPGKRFVGAEVVKAYKEYPQLLHLSSSPGSDLVNQGICYNVKSVIKGIYYNVKSIIKRICRVGSKVEDSEDAYSEESYGIRTSGIHMSVKSQLASGSKGTKGQSASASGSKGTKGWREFLCQRIKRYRWREFLCQRPTTLTN